MVDILPELVYQSDAYQRKCPAIVVGIDDAVNGVYLDRTVFYPGGGGQPSDSGVLASENGGVWPVIKVGRGNLHIVEGDLPAEGISVVAEIDWERRYRLMRTHTALHVLCGVVWRDYGALVTGGNMDELNARMDFEFERLQRDLVDEIEARINAEVVAERNVIVRILPREEAFAIPDLIRTKINLLPEAVTQVRTVEIVGLDLQACGGTHLANTAEIGRIRIAEYKSKGGINKRIYIELEG